jgi:translation initiation factor 1
LTTVQGIPPKFDHKKILKVIKKDFGRLPPSVPRPAPPCALRWPSTINLPGLACNGTIISDTESKGMGEVIQLQGDQRNKIKEFLTDKENGLGLDEKNIKVSFDMKSLPEASGLTPPSQVHGF